MVQAEETSAGMSRLPRSLAQWALPSASAPIDKLRALPPSRLSQVLLKHFHPTQSAHIKAARLRSHSHAAEASSNAHRVGTQSGAYTARPHPFANGGLIHSNPRIGPYLALPGEAEAEQRADQDHHHIARQSEAAAKQHSLVDLRAQSQRAKPAAAAGRPSRAATAERRPQSAGSDAVRLARAKPDENGNVRKSRARSVSLGSQYHFSSTSSVPDNDSWHGDAASFVSQQPADTGRRSQAQSVHDEACCGRAQHMYRPTHDTGKGKGRAGSCRGLQQALWQTGAHAAPVLTRYAVPDGGRQAQRVQRQPPFADGPHLLAQTNGVSRQQWLSDRLYNAQSRKLPRADTGLDSGVYCCLAVIGCIGTHASSQCALVYADSSAALVHICMHASTTIQD